MTKHFQVFTSNLIPQNPGKKYRVVFCHRMIYCAIYTPFRASIATVTNFKYIRISVSVTGIIL